MAIVSAISESRGIVEVTADGRAAVRVRKVDFAKCPLSVGESFDVEQYIGRVAAAQFAEGYEAALTSLDRSARTARQIADSLRRKGYVAPAVEAIVARLVENRLIDDERYAQRMAEMQAGKGVGVYAFRRKLKAKGISDEDAEAALEAFDEDQQRQAALAAAQKMAPRYENLPRREARAKLSQALARRGFSWEVIEGAVEDVFD